MNILKGIKSARLKRWFYRLIGIKDHPSALSRIEKYLTDHHVPYRRLSHPDAFSASELAETLDVTEKRIAKVVIVRADHRFAMAVVAAPLLVNLRRLARLLKVDHISLACEEELKTLFPDCETGTMPPFGNLYGLPVYVDLCLNREPLFFFAAGTHRDAIAVRYSDFDRLVKPKVGTFAAVPLQKVTAA